MDAKCKEIIRSTQLSFSATLNNNIKKSVRRLDWRRPWKHLHLSSPASNNKILHLQEENGVSLLWAVKVKTRFTNREGLLRQRGRGVPQRDLGGGVHHDGDGARLGGGSGRRQVGEAVRRTQPGLPAAAGGVRKLWACRGKSVLKATFMWFFCF